MPSVGREDVILNTQGGADGVGIALCRLRPKGAKYIKADVSPF